MLMLVASAGFAQRFTDRLDRGLVAQKVSGGVYLSWRVQAEEYFDVTYNVYRDGTLVNDEPLEASNFRDTGGTASSTYTIAPVIRGQEGAQCAPATVWAQSYLEIQPKHEGIKSRLCPNDATAADMDGDGELEIIMKFDNIDEVEQGFPKWGPAFDGVSSKEFSIFECFKLDGTRLWWINCGPNMGDFQNNEQNIACYDWDGDGRAEAVMRACDGTVVHMADGTTFTVGNANANVRGDFGGGVNWFVNTDGEYLLYMDGATGKPYQCIPYPLKRLESNENDLNRAWGDGYGHRCSKHFFGAPYFDGKHPSIFLARGIYTRHKMIAYDVDPASHQLSVRWRWTNAAGGPWFGQGFHNYNVADVDIDGRDEIVFGSMVIDDNGKGLSTTGLGHGDAQHTADLNPYVHGLETYTCLEHNPDNCYRDATTSKIYYRQVGGRDDGRSMAGNFCNTFPGAQGCSGHDGLISCVKNDHVSGLAGDGVHVNFRIYWDGDLCEETFTGNTVCSFGSWNPIYTCEGGLSNNGTKATPCFQGDILGDWREEIIMRTEDNNIRIYTTPTLTKFREPSLWYDHQYRNAMVWQMNGYNQPPHCSYFLGQLEGILMAPPPFTMNGRTETTSVSSAFDGQDVIVCPDGDGSASIDDGAAPAVLFLNVNTWVQGTAASESTNQNARINYQTFTLDITGGGLGGDARLVKQGDGIVNLPKADFAHIGNTDIWGGVVNFDGTMKQSPLWLNRFAELNSNGGEFLSIKADYASVIRPGGADAKGDITVGQLDLGFGSRIVVDLFSDGKASDCIHAEKLSIERKTGNAWVNGGPEYLMPVIEVVGHPADGQSEVASGKYVIAEFSELQGDAANLILEGLDTTKKKIYVEDGKLIVEIVGMRDAADIVWTGANSGIWDLAETANFKLSGQDAEATTFVSGDNIVFNDDATVRNVKVNADVQPASITVNNTQAYTFSGTGAIGGTASFTKEGTGMVTMSGSNTYTGGNFLKGGTVKVSQLSNSITATGNLGGITTSPNLFTMENGAVLMTTDAVDQASPMKMVGDEGGVISNTADFVMSAALSGTTLTKKGAGCLKTTKDNSLQTIIIEAGSMAIQSNNPAKVIELRGGTLYDDVQATTHDIVVPKNKKASWQLTGAYYTAYNNKVTGEGELTVVPRNTVQRVRITGDWSKFEGTIKHTTKNICLPLDNALGLPKGTLDIAEGCAVSNVAKAFTIGKLTGKGQLLQPVADFKSSAAVNGSNTWNVGNNDLGNFTFDGTFTDGGGANKCIFNKIGSCKMTVSGKSDLSGAVTVKAGELCLKAGATLGSGVLTVNSGATLSGVTGNSNDLNNSSISIKTGGTLQVGLTPTALSGVMRCGGKNVTIARGAYLSIGVLQGANGSSTGCTTLQNIDRLTMNGTIRLHLSSTIGDDIAEGDHIELWNQVTTVVGTPVLDPECLVIDEAKGLYWDTTDLAKGILRVTKQVPDAIRSLNGSTSNDATYTLDGRRTNDTRRGGIYVVGGRKVLIK